MLFSEVQSDRFRPTLIPIDQTNSAHFLVVLWKQLSLIITRGATIIFKVGAQFLGLEYYYLSTEKN